MSTPVNLYKLDAAVVGMRVECPFCQEDSVEVVTGLAYATCETEECGAHYGIPDASFLGLTRLDVRVEGRIRP